jgi:5-methylcytosine-specific restriction endonuclease McrA
MDHRVLLLNATYEPLKIISWERAICLWFDDKVEIVEEYDDFDITSISFTIKCPSVIRLLTYIAGNKNKIKFSRINVFSRDRFLCQYCGVGPGTSKLTYDHVIPRSRGGTTTWRNITTACLPCNLAKGSRTPQEAGMTLRSVPTKPEWNPRSRLFQFAIPKSPEAWRSYLYWSTELENDNTD